MAKQEFLKAIEDFQRDYIDANAFRAAASLYSEALRDLFKGVDSKGNLWAGIEAGWAAGFTDLTKAFFKNSAEMVASIGDVLADAALSGGSVAVVSTCFRLGPRAGKRALSYITGKVPEMGAYLENIDRQRALFSGLIASARLDRGRAKEHAEALKAV